MSTTVEARIDPPGEAAHVERAWELKERIRQQEGILKQRRRFFSHAYRRARVYLYFADDDLVGFAAARSDGYLLFLAVAPEHRGRGFGERLVADVADDADTVTCHARATNEEALGFYRHLGFEHVREITNYYEDGGDAYYLRLGDGDRLRDRISELLGR